MKRVRITVEVDSSFVALLNAKIELARYKDKGELDELDPAGALALVCLGEMRGGTEAQVDALIPEMWRDSLRIIHEERKVEEL